MIKIMIQAQRTPVDTTGIPQQPAPQTVEGTLSSDGANIPSFSVPLTGGFVEAQEATHHWSHVDQIEVSVNQAIDTHIGTWNFVTDEYQTWRMFAIACSEFVTPALQFRFWLVKPARVVGRYYFVFTYGPDSAWPNTGGTTSDPQYKQTMIEWDVAKTDYIDIDMPIPMRYDYVPTVVPYASVSSGTRGTAPDLTYCSCKLHMYVAMPLRVSSVYPDTYDLMVYRRYPCTLYGFTDPRVFSPLTITTWWLFHQTAPDALNTVDAQIKKRKQRKMIKR